MNGNPEIGRRVKAARALAGLDNVNDLAQKINQGGLSTKTLRAVEQGRRHAEPRELAAIASACGLPVAFFGMDFWEAARLLEEHAGQPTEADQLNAIAAVVDALHDRVSALEIAQGRVAVEALERVAQALRAAGLPAPPQPPQ